MASITDATLESLLFGEVAAPETPAAGKARLFLDSDDGILKWKDDGGNVREIGTALTNPMTTKGDIIVGDTDGLPSRLGAGTTGLPLVSNGSGSLPSWQYLGLTSASAALAAEQTLSSADTDTDVNDCSLSLAAGTWLLLAQVMFRRGSTDSYAIMKITTGANVAVAGGRGNIVGTGNDAWKTVPASALVSPGSTTTYKLRALSAGTTTKLQSVTQTGFVSTYILAVRIA